MAVNLTKEERIKKINLEKAEVHKIRLAKPGLQNLTSRVGVALDFSGSMRNLYNNQTVQETLEKILPMALEFDDNGSMELWIFENGFHRLPDVTIENFHEYVQREILNNNYRMGGTNYAPVMNDIVKKYTEEAPANIPSYILFLTDGDNSDKTRTVDTIMQASKLPIFWQFVGLGKGRFTFLEKLDDMTLRYVDNADFFQVAQAENITYSQLLNEYPGWVTNPKVQAMLR